MATKLETVVGYSNRRIRDTWMALGGSTVSDDTTYYTKNVIYQVSEAASALNGYLVFVNEDSFAATSWTIGTLVDTVYGEISFDTDIVDSRFTVVLTQPELAAIVEPVDTEWVPFSEAGTAEDISIPDGELEIILTDIGVPFITYDELEYSREKIVDLMVRPALEEYFKWFPKVMVQTLPVTNSYLQETPFPEDAYDVVHVGVNQGVTGSGVSNTLLRYFDEVVWMAGSPATSGGFAGGGSRRPRTHTMDWGGMMLDRAGRQAVINYGTRIHQDVYRDDDGNKILRTSSNKMGTMEIHWALKSFTWNDVEFARLPELREMARGRVLKGFGAIRSQAKSDLPGTVDYKDWVSIGEEMITKVRADWMELVKTSGVIRGSH